MNAPAPFGCPVDGPGPLFLSEEVEVIWAGDLFQLQLRDGSLRHDLSAGQALALLLLADAGDSAVAREIARAVHPALSAGVDQVLHRFPAYLRGHIPRPFDASWWGRHIAHVRRTPSARYAAPASVTWLVTLECNRRCPYCFYKILPVDGSSRRWPTDAVLRGESATRVIDELARLGTADVYLTGGEPMLRPDICDLVAHIARRGIRAHIVTKFAIDWGLAESLAAAGLFHLTISLDDERAEVAQRLTGAPAYPPEAFAAIEACLTAGLTVEVNAVLTSLNEEALPRLAARLEHMGCEQLTISPLQEPVFRKSNVSGLLTTTPMSQVVDEVRSATTGRVGIEAGPSELSESRRPCGSDLVCEVGTRSLHILPNGDVTRCHYVPARPELIIGSLMQSSVMQIWNGSSMSGWRDPGQDAFSGTMCENCAGIGACNRRGRCVASALLEHDRLYAPDAFCGRL